MTLLPMNGFNPEKPWETGQNSLPVGLDSPMPQQPQTPFLWGAGGARLSPEQILAQREMANNQMQADFSPVGSVWEGLGRVANNVTGALQNRSLNKQDQLAASDRMAQIAALLGGENADLAGAFASGDKTVSGLAGDVFAMRNPKPRNPFEFEGLLGAAGFKEGTPEYQAEAARLLAGRNDPFITATLPTGDFYAGPQSQFTPYLQGQGQSQAAPLAQPPATLPPDFDFEQGGPTQPASGGFRPGG